jgi:hypothetical protein
VTESEWLGEGYGQFAVVQDYASMRKLLLIAAAFVRRLQSLPPHGEAKEYGEAKECDDLIEGVADVSTPWEVLESQLHQRPGNWQFTHILHAVEHEPDRVVIELRKFFAFYRIPDDPELPISLLHEIVGNPFRPVVIDPDWLTSTVLAIARGCYEERTSPWRDLDNSRLAVLADALEDAGCNHPDLLGHLRRPGRHVRGCWALDSVLGL